MFPIISGVKMETQSEEKKKYRVIRQYHNKDRKLDYDLYMNLKSDLKRITTIQTRTIAEGVNTSEFVVVIEDETRNKCTVEYWRGQKDVVTGFMHSKRQFQREINYDVGHLFVSEITQNCFSIPNNSEHVAEISDKVLEFAKTENGKTQKIL
jgi:hypothetical protein